MGGDLSAKMQEPYLILYFLTGVPLVGFSENLVHLGVGDVLKQRPEDMFEVIWFICGL